MQDILVIQSHRSPLPYPWLDKCLQSVREWAEQNRYEYRFIGDELFNDVPEQLIEKTTGQLVVATDIARLLISRDVLANGYEAVIWFDADFLIFNPSEFIIPEQPYAVGREVWVQHDRNGKLRAYKKVHNAFLLFRQGNSFLEFYIETAMRLLSQHNGALVPQFIGPKLLTALHNVSQLPVMESAGMLSPMVIKDMLNQGGTALDLFHEYSPQPITAANLCISSCDKNDLSSAQIEQLIDMLLA